MTQSQFKQELLNFIQNHEYYKQIGGETLEIPQADKTIITLNDPDGDYEALQINIFEIP